MNNIVLSARLLLAAVFLLAALTKLADRAGSRQALRDFGLPAVLAAPFGLLLPLAELAVAVALIPTASAFWGALGAAALLLLFVGGIGYNLARGRKPDCHCFGQLHSEPAGWPAIGRNAGLAAVSGLILVQGPGHAGSSATAWLGDLSTAERASLTIAVLGVALAGGTLCLLLQLIAQNGRLLVRLEGIEGRLASGVVGDGNGTPAAGSGNAPAAAGLPIGTPAPHFSLSGLFGETLTLDALRAAGKPVLLGFVDPSCGPCNALLPDLARWQRELEPALTLVAISRGAVEENRVKSAEHGLTRVLLQQDREVAEAYQASGTPALLLVRADGTIGSAAAMGAEQIGALVARTMGTPLPVVPDPALPVMAAGAGQPCPQCGRVHALEPQPPMGLAVGTAAPSLRLPDLDGHEVDLAEFRDSPTPTLLLFWNPGCGFCQRMLDDIKAWEEARPDGAPRLLVVSTGGREANAAQGFRSPVLLDEGFATGGAFGGSGTPSALLVDGEGKIASALAVGAEAVLGLARGEQHRSETAA